MKELNRNEMMEVTGGERGGSAGAADRIHRDLVRDGMDRMSGRDRDRDRNRDRESRGFDNDRQTGNTDK